MRISSIAIAAAQMDDWKAIFPPEMKYIAKGGLP